MCITSHLTIPRSTAHERVHPVPRPATDVPRSIGYAPAGARAVGSPGLGLGRDRSVHRPPLVLTAHSSFDIEASHPSARVDVCRRVTENVGIPLTYLT